MILALMFTILAVALFMLGVNTWRPLWCFVGIGVFFLLAIPSCAAGVVFQDQCTTSISAPELC